MSIIQAIVLGLVQGLTEFVPVSSSGHLVLVPFVLGWKEPALPYVVAIHVGTLVAVIYVFREELGVLARAAFGWRNASPEHRKLFRVVAIATVPAMIVGVSFKAAVGDAFDRPVLISLLLGVTGYFLLSTESATEFSEATARNEEEITDGDALTVGIAQAISVLPGISRSGSTIGAGMRRGLTREAAARFSFLLSIPIIAGAVLVELPDIFKRSTATPASLLIGILVAGVSGFFSIRWFLGIVVRRGLRPFGVYCMFAMVAGVITALARG